MSNFYKKISQLLMLIIIGMIVGCQTQKKEEEFVSRLTGFEIPEAGSELPIKYHPKNGPLYGQNNIHVLIYQFNDYRWELEYASLHKENNNEWSLNYKLPDDCSFVALLFVSPQEGSEPLKDNNDDNGFVYTVKQQEKNELVAGANLAWGTFRKPEFTHLAQGYFNEFTISDEALEFWVKKEIEKNMANLPKFFGTYMNMAKYRTGEKFDTIGPGLIQQYLNQFGDQVTEKNYQDIIRLYRFDLKNTDKSDSLNAVMLKKFPKGIQARFNAYSKAIQSNKAEKPNLLKQFLDDFPIGEWRNDNDAAYQKFMYDNVIQSIAVEYFMSDDVNDFQSVIQMADYNVLVDIYHWTVDRCYGLKLKPFDYCLEASDSLIKLMLKKKNDNSYKSAYAQAPWRIQEHCTEMLDNKLAKHIQLLNATEQLNKISEYYNLISEGYKYTNVKLNEIYADYLKASDSDGCLEFLEKCAYYNTISEKLLAELKSLYINKNNSEEGFDLYYQNLKDAKSLDDMKLEIEKNFTQIDYVPFQLSGPDGLSVDSKDFDDKIVILDFWANWCGPCKKVFPGMQILVDQYKKDKNVEFYFIDTQEAGTDYKDKAIKYMQKKGFTFNVLFDEAKEDSEKNIKVFSTFSQIFNSSGIPRKVVLKNGKIRYSSEGFSGSASKLVDELNTVISILKNE